MNMRMKIWGCLLMAAVTFNSWAQGGTDSPYSQYGLGVLSDPSQSMSRGMNGVGQGLRVGYQVNTLNPASYSSVDSLTMLFDAGLALQTTNFKEGNTRQNASSADVEYVVGSFRAVRNVGIAFGVLPMTNVGYSYSTKTFLDAESGSVTHSYSGSGGLHQAFVGVGWRVAGALSVGANIGYVWGDLNRTVVTTGSSSVVNTLAHRYSSSVSSYALDLGLQWDQRIGKADRLTLGATLGVGHKLGTDPELNIVSTNNVSSTSDTTHYQINNGLELPLSLSAGLAYAHANHLLVAADVAVQKWGRLDFPQFNSQTGEYRLASGLLKDRMTVNAGLDWTPNPISRHFFNRVHYRIGAGLSTPYYKIDGQDGPKDVSVSAGFGIPILNQLSNRSVLNISAQWVHSSASGLITENSFRLNIGVTFNERWFAKWKID